MPKPPHKDKKSVAEKRSRHAVRKSEHKSRSAPQSLENIMKNQGWLQGLQRARSTQQLWLEWMNAVLPVELRAALVNVVLKGNDLTVLAVSAAWSARLRFAVAAIEPEIRARAPAIVKVTVRVAPGPPGAR